MKKLYAFLLMTLAAFGFAEAQNVTVNPGAGSYPTLKAAFDAINAGTHTGAVTVEIVGNTTETVSAVLNGSGTGGANYSSVMISPSGGAARTITGIIAAAPLIDLNGADNVTINGLNTGGNSLTISNGSGASTSGTSTIRFIGDAIDNTITNSTILGASTMSTTTLGGTIFFSTGTSSGNDNNTISNNNIGSFSASALPTKAIFSIGTTTSAAHYNSGINITGNNIYDYFNAAATSNGIYLGAGSQGWNIANNKFYQTATRTQTTAAIHACIQSASATSQAHTVTGNTFGFSNAAGTGTYNFEGVGSGSRFLAFYISTAATTGTGFTNFTNNLVSGISMSGNVSGTTTSASFLAVYLLGEANASGNTFGSLNGSSGISFSSSSTSNADFYCVYNNSASATDISGNNIGNITLANSSTGGVAFIALRAATSSSAGQGATMSNNTIGSAAAPITNNAVAASSRVVGIYNSVAYATINNNVIRHMTCNAPSTGTTTAASVAGIIQSGTSVNGDYLISNNTIHSLKNINSTGTATSVIGLYNAGSTTATAFQYTLFNNNIHSLINAATSPTATLYGIYQASGQFMIYNNMVRLGIDETGASLTNDIIIRGIYEASTSAFTDLYFNSVYVGGTGVVAATANTYAFESLTTSTTAREYKNNIFFNARSNASGSANHYAIKIAGTGANPAGLTADRNDYYVSGSNGVIGFYDGANRLSLAGWQAATGLDANSYSVNPGFANPTGSAATGSLKINTGATPNPLESGGEDIAGITTDFEGDSRPGPAGSVNGGGTAPDVGADEFDGTPAVQMVYGSSNTVQQTGTAYISGNQAILRIDINTTGSTNPLVVSQFTFNANGTTNISDIANADVYYTGSSTTFAPNLLFGSAAATLANFSVTGSQALAEGNNYFWLVYDISPAATPGNVIDAELVNMTIGGVVRTPTTSAPAGNKMIVGPLAGNYNVGVGQTSPNFVTITEAVENLEGRGVSGPVSFTLVNPSSIRYDASNGETFPIIINPFTGVSPTNTLTIKAGTGVQPVIEANIASTVIRLNAADYVIIDGSNNGTSSRDLTISNSSTSTSSAVIWANSVTTPADDAATNNIIRNCIIDGNSATTTLVGIGFGSATISISSLGNGNNNNVIHNNQISGVQYGVYSQGASATNKNAGNTISGNSITGTAPNGIGRAGIFVGFEDGVTIVSNTIGGVTTSSDGAGITLGTISITTTSPGGNEVTNATISKNSIGSVISTSSSSAIGIYVAPATSGVTTIDNNVIAGVTAGSTTPDIAGGIYVAGGAGSVTNIYFNSVSMTGVRPGSPSFPSFALAIAGSNPTVDVRNNILYNTQTTASAGKSYAYGLAYTTYTSLISSNNDLFVAGANGVLTKTGALTNTGGTDYTTLAAWNAQTGQDPVGVSLSVDPMFNSPTNLRPLPGSPVIGAGVMLPAFPTDFLGVTRNDPPSMGAYEQAADVTGPMITYTPLSNTGSTANRTTTGFASIADDAGVNVASGTRPRLYYKRSTDANTLGATNDNTTNGWKWVEANNTTSPFDFTIDYTKLFGGTGVAVGDTIEYFVVAQDMSTTPNVGINAGTFAAQPSTVALTAAAFPLEGAVNEYVILPSITGVFNVGPGQVYTSLTADGGLFEAMNAAAISGNITANITGDITIEDGANGLNQFNEIGVGNYTLTIQPTGGATRTVSGTNATALITLNGADRVTMNGLNAGGNTLIIRNAGASGAVIRLVNGANDNTITNSILEGGNTSTSSGLIALSTGTAGMGNSGNTISGNRLRERTDGSFTPYAIGIYSSGTDGALNSDNLVENNHFINFTSSGINITGTGNGNDWNISGNHFYNNQAPSTAQTGIVHASDSSFNTIISNNYIGGSAPNATGMWTNSGNVQINAMTISAGIVTISNNTIANITGTNTGTTTRTRGINFTADTSGSVIQANTIYNLSSMGAIASYSSGSQAVVGIYYFPGDFRDVTIRQNRIYNLSLENTSALTSSNIAVGMMLTNMGGSATENIIYDIKNKGTGVTAGQPPIAAGMYVRFLSGIAANNMISVGRNESSNVQYTGILVAGGDITNFAASYFLHNTVLVSGTATGSHSSYAFLRGNNTATTQLQADTLRNNIFVNTRAGGGSANYAIGNQGTEAATNWSSNYNDLYTTDPATLGLWNATSYDFAGWQAASAGDANSLNVLPVFLSDTILHLDPTVNQSLDNKGTPVPEVSTDIDGEARSTTPDMGADEFTSGPLPVNITSIKAYQQNNGVQVDWTSVTEVNLTRYEVERSVDGRNFATAGRVEAKGGTSFIAYGWFDREPVQGNNYYRVRSINRDGTSDFTPVVRVFIGKGAQMVSVYPNPVRSETINLQLNNVDKGKYTLILTNQLGQRIYSQVIDHQGGSANQTINAGSLFVKGIYQLQLTGEGVSHVQRIVRQ